MSDPSERAARIDPRLVRLLGDTAVRYSAQVLVADFLPGGPKLYNGTATLVQLGSKKFAVTCAHVVAKHRQIWAKGRRSLFQIGNLRFEPLQQRYTEEPNLDLVTIELSELQAEQVIKNEGTDKGFLVPVRWPPAPVSTADWLGLGGYPGEWRERETQARVGFKGYSIVATPVTSVSEFGISCQFARDRWSWVNRGDNLQDPVGLGGMSGGPALVWREAPFLHWEFAGIIYEFNCSIDVMLLRPAQLLGEDGSISSPPWTNVTRRCEEDDGEEPGNNC